MKYEKILKTLDEKESFNRSDIYEVMLDNGYKIDKNSMSWVIGEMIDDKSIVRESRNKYTVYKDDIETKDDYSYDDNEICIHVRNIIKSEYPNVEFCVWNIGILNEFLNHMISRDLIILECENDLIMHIMNLLVDNGFTVILKPQVFDIDIYYKEDLITIN